MKCHTINCSEPARDGEFCFDCHDEIYGTPVTMREIVHEIPSGLLLVAFCAAIGLLIYGASR